MGNIRRRHFKELARGAWALPAMLLASLPLVAGCLNPNFLNSTSGGLYPLAPGDQPFVLATLINDTQAILDVKLLVDEGRTSPTSLSFIDLDPLSRTAGTLVPFPILRIGVGDLDDPFAPSTVATFANGLTVQVPTGLPALVAGVDFKEGDTIIFHFIGDPQVPSAIRTSIGVLDGSSQVGPFGRADTFETVKILLLLNFGSLIPSP